MIKKMYYIANARMPNEKAHGIQIAKMCEAFAEAGENVVLVVPGRGSPSADLRSFYQLRVDISLVRLQVPDLYTCGRTGFLVSSVLFMMRCVFFLFEKRIRGERFLIYTIDMDTFSTMVLPLLGMCVTEIHAPKKATAVQRFFFKHVRGVVATNALTKASLAKTFSFPLPRMIVEPNGVDAQMFASFMPKDEARRRLSLPPAEKIALYVGRLYPWKGLEILPVVCEKLVKNGISCYVVGGTAEELERLSGNDLPPNLHCVGAKAARDIPAWIAASDVALVLGTAHNEESYRFTSPMKLFEYMASRIPMVASGTPALKDVLTDRDALFYEPDNPASLAQRITEAVTHSKENAVRVNRAYEKAQEHTWGERAQRILAFCAFVAGRAKTV
ncbi:TPA: hypothetical protein DIV48_01160 [Candidatus Kaiserbacteria bacterium]|nr:MAG: Glycosyl transferase group 1 [Parcubacteria group bacterium GW2011_GWA1_56_13]KKW46313.1 MAG: Glycosyl transferase group 1 [Parcubacteria group bacterium GW2011_GWB1_57_6]HCR52240.1 hypothetical protein [Candidatus Kaiserbacteria bacterium]